MIQDIILDALLSGVAGYATNKHVIDALSKEYSILGKSKFGGAILNSKEKLIENIASMMEKDIINAQKISLNFSDYNLTDEFEKFSKHFMDECIFRDIKNLRLKDISDFYDICYCVKDMLIGVIRTNISDIVEYVSQGIDLNELITDNQAVYIANSIIDNLLLTIKNTNMVETVFLDLYDDFCDYKITDFASKTMLEKIKSNIEKESTKIPNILKNKLDEKIDDCCHNILKSVDLKSTIQKSVEHMLDKPLRSIMVMPLHELKEKVFKSIMNFVNSEKGEKAITDLYYDIVEYLENNKTTLADICTNQYQITLKKYTEEKLNSIVYSSMQWLEHNNVEIDKMIKNSVDDVISIKSPVGKKIYSTIMSFYLDNRYGDNSIYSILFNCTKSSINMDKISSFVINQVTDNLKSTSFKDVFDKFEEEKIINSNIFYSLIVKKLKENGNSIISKEIDSLLSNPLRQFIKLDIERLSANGKIEYIFIDYIKENTFYSKQTCQNVTKLVNEYISESFGKKLGEICDKASANELVSNIKNQLINDINDNRFKLGKKLVGCIRSSVQSSNIKELLSLVSESGEATSNRLIRKISEYINKNFSTAIESIGDIRISKILSTINKIPNLNSGLSNIMKDVVGGSIATITDGYIKQSVQQHFNDLTDDQFIDFIKQINLIDNKGICFEGSIVSAVSSIPFSILSTNILHQGLIGQTFSWQGAVMCSLLGISTNIIAMSRFSDIIVTNSILKKIPLFSNCTDDFIKEKQKMFAHYMEDVIERNLIDSDTVQDLIQSKSTNIKESIYYSLKKDDSEKIFNCIKDNKKQVAKLMAEGTKVLLKNNKDNLINVATKGISDIPIKYLLNRNSIDYIGEKISSNENVIKQIDNYIIKSLNEKNISQIIPNKITGVIKENIVLGVEDSYLNNIEFIKNIQSFKQYLSKNTQQYKKIMNKPINSLFSYDALDDVEGNIFNVIYDTYFSRDKVNEITDKIYDLIITEYFKDKCLNNLINRRSKVLLTGMIYKYFNDIITGLSNHLSTNIHEELEYNIIQNILANLDIREKAIYNELGGNKLVKKIIDKLTLIEIPKFIDNNFEQFYEISKNILKDMYDLKISEFNIQIDKESFNKLISEMFFVNYSTNSFIKNKSYLIFHQYTNKYKELEFEHVAKLFNINTLNGICSTYGGEISNILKIIYNSIKKDKENSIAQFNDIVDDIYKYAFSDTNTKDILAGLPQESIQPSIEFIKKVSKDKELVLLSVKNMFNIYYNYLEDMDLLNTMIDINDFKLQLSRVYDDYITSENFDNYGLKLYSKIIESDLQSNISYYLTGRVKKYFIDILVDGFYLAIKRDLVDLFKCIELDKLTEKGILKLEPKEFQKLFRVIWKNNKKAMYITGSGGALFGFNKYVAETISLTGIIRNLISFVKRKRAEVTEIKSQEKDSNDK